MIVPDNSTVRRRSRNHIRCGYARLLEKLELISNGEIISSAIFCSNLASDGKLGERSVAGYTTADALPSRTRDG